MNKICAIVVTYNRKILLKQSLQALLDQTVTDFDILVVDNASTDNTREYIDDLLQEERIDYVNTGANLGGSGGFNHGLKVVCKRGYQYVWMMDDDTMPTPTALEKILEADKILGGNYGYLASEVLFTDGQPCKMNGQKVLKKWFDESQYLKNGILRTTRATFVSFFVRTAVVEKVGLSYKEFFIWGDDMEYSNRISKQFPCYMVAQSIVVHHTKNNDGSSIAKDDGSRLWQYKLAYRNECVIAREDGLYGRCYQFAKVNWNILKVIGSHKPLKLKKIWILISASIRGIFFRPKIEYIKLDSDK
ncbi:glycosyltransferase family 2 protein [Limosilactobacillus fermentum]|uniref:glycosyltransferase family 2 protein n=1 Tax=Limosilactobacillus fermentum TaxID=1613 RepID=UPI002D78C24C|nr:glycosyltransferase family 2 protein [Limosilactobacillus fermentum]WRQ24281.1 glycosyltransferase family 2 protein [Limosilactobacillus fermentum]